MDVFSKFETELAVRPDDIDLYQHVHSTRYLDYVLAARFEQMEKNYGLSMQAFADRGLGWFMNAAADDYKLPPGGGDRLVLRPWVV
ncbi:MAG: acyl-CoA thioesterase, partial [Verrucomicrobia bacterium]|nr:acyl-CoA thioesterase [Verrucomicrobiota bacterium]